MGNLDAQVDLEERAANILQRVSDNQLFSFSGKQDLNDDGTIAFDELCVVTVENYDPPSCSGPPTARTIPFRCPA